MLIRLAVVVGCIFFVLKSAAAAAVVASSRAHAHHIKMNVDAAASASGDDWRLGVGHQRSRRTTEFNNKAKSQEEQASPLIANISSSASCSYSATCSVGGYSGACVSISGGCCATGKATSGLCPGSSDVQCCTESTCSTPSGLGTCQQTSRCSSIGGTSFPGYCTGPSDQQCCVMTDPDPNPQPPSSNNIYYTDWCGGELQYLDDKYCIKKFPSIMDR